MDDRKLINNFVKNNDIQRYWSN